MTHNLPCTSGGRFILKQWYLIGQQQMRGRQAVTMTHLIVRLHIIHVNHHYHVHTNKMIVTVSCTCIQVQ